MSGSGKHAGIQKLDSLAATGPKQQLPGGHERDEQECGKNVEYAAYCSSAGGGRPLRGIRGHPVLDLQNLLSGAAEEC